MLGIISHNLFPNTKSFSLHLLSGQILEQNLKILTEKTAIV